MRGLVRGSFVALMMVLASGSEAWACPMCKLALETDDPQPRAYMLSILFMLGMIGSMFAVVTGLLIWLSRRERLELEAAGYQHLFENGVSHPTPESLRRIALQAVTVVAVSVRRHLRGRMRATVSFESIFARKEDLAITHPLWWAESGRSVATATSEDGSLPRMDPSETDECKPA